MKYSVIFILLGLLALTQAEDDETMALKFLNQYHYISTSRSGNHNVKLAIRRFQRFAGLKVTGKLDRATIDQMKKPRCGLPDDEEEGGRVRRYTTGPKWSKKSLTYFVEYGEDLSHDQQDSIFQKALQYWSDVSGLSFSTASSSSAADIKISFGAATHGGSSESTCPYPFDGEGGVLAHAYYPSDGRAHFDEDEEFTDNTPQGINLLWVATHEFGHSLGIGHSDVKGAIMYPYYTGYVEGMELHSDDIAAIQYLYGAS
ncbi:the peptidase M10A [Porites harrisoni]